MQTISGTSEAALEERLQQALPRGVDDASIRLVDEQSETVVSHEGHLQPITTNFDLGAMVSVWADGGLGYAATSDLTEAGLARAVERATHWARVTASAAVAATPPRSDVSGSYETPVEVEWSTMPLRDQIDLIQQQSERLNIDERIVARTASISRRSTKTLLLTASGARIEQRFHFSYPELSVTASDGKQTQSRSFGAHARCGQGGVEVLARHGFGDAATRIAEQAIELLTAPNCPTGTMDVLLAPDQMILQIHESIGHPLEIDRILGDERNYAGTSFVTPDMFGSYRYGSELLNVTFDPTVAGQVASYAFDDEGTPAERHHIIQDGVLVRGLGGSVSQSRSGLSGVANTRACSWNRPPIDRMANLNVEPGTSSLADLVSSIENGVYLETNSSWSIDDSRNKFQFSCEYGRRVENGELTTVIRNPSYRGVSRNFWRNLKGVGNADTWQVLGTPNCGKGELNQTVSTGHASPPCLFGDVAVFGSDEQAR